MLQICNIRTLRVYVKCCRSATFGLKGLKEVGIDWFSVSVKPYVLGLIPGTYHRLENFHVKNNSRENFCVVKFSRFRSIDKLFLTVDSFIMDERLESS